MDFNEISYVVGNIEVQVYFEENLQLTEPSLFRFNK